VFAPCSFVFHYWFVYDMKLIFAITVYAYYFFQRIACTLACRTFLMKLCVCTLLFCSLFEMVYLSLLVNTSAKQGSYEMCHVCFLWCGLLV